MRNSVVEHLNPGRALCNAATAADASGVSPAEARRQSRKTLIAAAPGFVSM